MCDRGGMTPWRPGEVLQHHSRGPSYSQSANLELQLSTEAAVVNGSLSRLNQLLYVHHGVRHARENKSSSLRITATIFQQANQISLVSVDPVSMTLQFLVMVLVDFCFSAHDRLDS